MAKKVKTNYSYSAGRRRTASARVRLFKGSGVNTVNGLEIDKYFPGPFNQDIWSKPFRVLDLTEKYYMSAKVAGGGPQGQLGAVALAIARAFAKEREEFRKPLKKAGLLTRDPRTRERRKVNTGGKARRVKQSPKR